MHKVAGTTYTKKNICSSLGKNPFFVMDGGVASFSLFDGKSGKVLGSALTPVHGGYFSVDEVHSVVNVRQAVTGESLSGKAQDVA